MDKIGIRDNPTWRLEHHDFVSKYQNNLSANIFDCCQCHRNLNKILINLESVELVDSAAVVVLVKASRLAKSKGKELGLCSVNTQVRMVLELTQLDRFVEMYDSEADFFGHRYELMAA